MAKKNCGKFQPTGQGARMLQTTDSQTTDGTAIAYSDREREFTFAKNLRFSLRGLGIYQLRWNCGKYFIYFFWIFHTLEMDKTGLTFLTTDQCEVPVALSEWECGTLCRHSPLSWSCRCWWVGCIYGWLGLGDTPAPVVLPTKWLTGWCQCHQRSEGSWLLILQSVVHLEVYRGLPHHHLH